MHTAGVGEIEAARVIGEPVPLVRVAFTVRDMLDPAATEPLEELSERE